MIQKEIIKYASEFEQEMFDLIEFSIGLDIERFRISATLCMISFEHWSAARTLIENNLFPSAITIMRSQYEALVRSVWSQNFATNDMIAKLSNDLDKDAEQAAKNLPSVNDMMKDIQKSAHKNISAPLSEIKIYSWNAFNSFTHSGIHAISRFRNGFPEALINTCYRQSNGMALLTGMQYLLLCGKQELQKELVRLSLRYAICMPSQS